MTSCMADIRANCPTCGQVGMKAAAISLRIHGDGERGEYTFSCPDCGTDVTRAGDRKVVALLLAAGVDAKTDVHELPPQDCSPHPDGPAFTLDDLIDLHFLLDDDVWLADEVSQALHATRR